MNEKEKIDTLIRELKSLKLIKRKFNLLVSIAKNDLESKLPDEFESSLIKKIQTWQKELEKEFSEMKMMAKLMTKISEYIFELEQKLLSQKCDMNWEDLKETKNENEKFCDLCHKKVFSISNATEYLEHQKLNSCVYIWEKINKKKLPTKKPANYIGRTLGVILPSVSTQRVKGSIPPKK